MEVNQPRAIRRWSNRVIIGAAIGILAIVALVSAIIVVVVSAQSNAQSLSNSQFITTLFSTPDPDSQSNALAISQAAPTPTDAIQPTATPNGDWQNGDRVNVLVMGIDQRPVENASYANTDSLILLTMNPISKTAGMMSIPRDLWVNLANHGQDRINTAMASGGAVYAMQEVGKALGVPVHHYVRVNFTALQKLVDLIGGIDVYVDQDINDQQYPDMNYHYDPFVISAGLHHMDGATALKYARTRHNTSDFYRMRRQQQIILAVRDRALSINALPNLAANASEIMGTMAGAVVSDLSVPEMAQLALAAKEIPAENISKAVLDENVAADYRTAGGAQVLILQPDKLPALIQQFYGQ